MKEKNALIAVLSITVAWMGYQLWDHNNRPRPCAPSAQASATPSAPLMSTAQEKPSERGTPIHIRNRNVRGTIDTKGPCVYQWALTKYVETNDTTHPYPVLMNANPADSVRLTWRAHNECDVPSNDTQWRHTESTLTPQTDAMITWTNSKNVKFDVRFSIDDDYMMTVHQRVTNAGTTPITLSAQAVIERKGTIQQDSNMVVHSGGVGVMNNKLTESTYKDLRSKKNPCWSIMGNNDTKEWLGFTDQSWLMALIPSVGSHGTLMHDYTLGQDRFMASCCSPQKTVAPGEQWTETTSIFIGPKTASILAAYGRNQSIAHFDQAIDYGRLFFITKPLLALLTALKKAVGNFGVAILIMTVLVKAVMLPFAIKSHRSMARMRALQPQLNALKDRFGSDKMRLNQEMMALYKRANVNPAAGCVPMLIQAPIFFALYKVFFISIDMRQASFLWVNDLSSPDSLYLFNGFGLLPWTVPSFLQIGLWPVLMGLSMIAQQHATPAMAGMDKQQRFMMTYFMPVMFTFMMNRFPAGIVIYWTWNNVLGIVQQWAMNKKYAQ